jgi:hypothetical protein
MPTEGNGKLALNGAFTSLDVETMLGCAYDHTVKWRFI